MKTRILEILTLISVLVFAGFLYFYKLDKIPSGFYVDEASVAYNAISIFETGKDEFGYSYPIVFRLLGSYSPSLFIYLNAFLIKYFGSEPILFRSITAVATLISVIFFYLLSKKMGLFKFKISYFVVLFFYAISPWVVFNARLGYETTFGYVVFLIGTYFLFSSIRKPSYLVFGTLFLSLSTYVSHNQRYLGPLFLLLFLVVFWKIFFKKENKKHLVTAFIVGFLSQIPYLSIINTNAFWIKSSQFNPDYLWLFLKYLSPRTLFYENPDIDLQHTIPKLSVLFNWMVIPYFLGLYIALKNLKDLRFRFLIIYVVANLLPSVFSSQFYSSQKTLPLVVPILLIIGVGIDKVLSRITRATGTLLLLFVSSYSLIILYSSYFILFPKERAIGWNYGYNQIAEYIKKNPQRQFLFDSARNPRAYILLLYHLRIPGNEYYSEIGNVYRTKYYSNPGLSGAYHFRNVEVREIDWEKDPGRDIVVIGDSLSISESQAKEHKLVKAKEWKDPLGNIIFEAYQTISF